MRNIEIMLNDGMLGNKASLIALSSLTTGNLNSKLKKEAKPYRMEDILPSVYDYIVPPLTDEEKEMEANNKLLAFARMSPNAPRGF